MANAHVNSALTAISGTVDGYVYRRFRDRTLLCRKPHFTAPWSDAQQATRRTFAGGSEFAKLIKADAELRARYALAGRRHRRRPRNYRQVAISDFFHPPKVESLKLDGYTATAGGGLAIVATDNFEVVRVQVRLREADGALVAEGDATLHGGYWQFNAPAIPPNGRLPASAEVTAFDRPGNSTVRTFPLPAAATA